MSTIVKRYRKRNGNGGYDYSEKEITDVIYSHMNHDANKLNKLYFLIKKLESKPNGRYMIKKQSLKYAGLSYNHVAYRKTYFLANNGVSFAVNHRKHPEIFYTNNKRIAQRLAKLLTGSGMELISIVDRKESGKETYVLNNAQRLRSNKIIVK